jgi:hypothetical protein
MQATRWFSALRIGCCRHRLGAALVAAALFAAASPAPARRDLFGNEIPQSDFDESQAPQWKESRPAMPPFPDDADLVAVPMNDTDTLKIFLDRKSLSRLPDRVARFTLVVQSRAGARSVFYDGLRCETRQYKTYAVGTDDHRWLPASQSQWRDIPRPEINAFLYQLYRRYVCDESSSARTPDEILRRLQS